MNATKVVSVSSSSSYSFEEAIRKGVQMACRKHQGVTGASVVQEQLVIREDDSAEYRVCLSLTFAA